MIDDIFTSPTRRTRTRAFVAIAILSLLVCTAIGFGVWAFARAPWEQPADSAQGDRAHTAEPMRLAHHAR